MPACRPAPITLWRGNIIPQGAGSVFTFGVKGGYDAGVKVVEACELLSHLANMGETRSLILHPASTTHRQLTEAQRIAAGAGDDVIRLSIGLETVDDIIARSGSGPAVSRRLGRKFTRPASAAGRTIA